MNATSYGGYNVVFEGLDARIHGGVIHEFACADPRRKRSKREKWNLTCSTNLPILQGGCFGALRLGFGAMSFAMPCGIISLLGIVLRHSSGLCSCSWVQRAALHLQLKLGVDETLVLPRRASVRIPRSGAHSPIPSNRVEARRISVRRFFEGQNPRFRPSLSAIPHGAFFLIFASHPTRLTSNSEEPIALLNVEAKGGCGIARCRYQNPIQASQHRRGLIP